MKNALVYRTTESGITPTVEQFEDYKGMQAFVDGYIERIGINPIINGVEYDIYINEEGLYTDFPISMALYFEGQLYSIVKGNFFISKCDDEGESVSLTEEDIMAVREWVAVRTHKMELTNREDGEKVIRKMLVAHYDA